MFSLEKSVCSNMNQQEAVLNLTILYIQKIFFFITMEDKKVKTKQVTIPNPFPTPPEKKKKTLVGIILIREHAIFLIFTLLQLCKEY